LRLYDGQYEPIHHHRWLVSVTVSAPQLDSIGAVMDFNELARLLDSTLAELDGKNLNKHSAFQDRNSSTEYVAEYIAQKLMPELPQHVSLDSVTLYRDEALRAHFTYRPSA
jgi:6-pyruvoyltetrahydropterin/6-carboxytetrahydropterin synthase